MSDPAVKVINDTEILQEGEITFSDIDNLTEVKNAIAVIAKLRRRAIEYFEIADDSEEEGTAVTSVEFRVEGNNVIAHVTQGLID